MVQILLLHGKTASGGSGSGDKISEGNTEAEVVDNGSDGHFKVTTEGTERFRITSDGKVGIGTDDPNTLLHLQSTNPILKITDSNQATDNKSWNISAGIAQILRIQAINDSGTGGGKLFDFYRTGTRLKNS